MKKYLFLAVAVVAMAACSKTEVVDTFKDRDAINFNAFFHKTTRANLIASDNISEFEVTAMLGTGTYFSEVAVTNNGSAWTYSPVQYWPAEGTLDFFAWAPTASGTGITKGSYKTFTVAPAADAASQYDFIVARTQGTKDAETGNGAKNDVTINFRHAMSQIAVKVYNGNKNLQYDIYGWQVGGVDADGTFTLADSSTDGTGKLAYSDWTDNTGSFSSVFYDDFALANIATEDNQEQTDADAITGAASMILVPQKDGEAAEKYSADTADAGIAGSYIAIDMTIRNSTDGTVVAARQWCCWPAEFSWEPGYKYTYVIDLSQGGYKAANDGKDEKESETGKADDDLDKVLDDAEIVFATVTVDSWDTSTADIPVNM